MEKNREKNGEIREKRGENEWWCVAVLVDTEQTI